MLQATEFRALPAIQSGPVCLQPDHVLTGWDRVDFARQSGKPDTMDHIVRRDLQHHRTAHRNVNFVSRADLLVRAEIRIIRSPTTTGARSL